MKDAAIIEGRKISKHFGSLQVIDNVDLKVTKGTIHAVIGPNGAGKTTLFNLLTGFLRLTEGEIFFKGENITNLSPFDIAVKGIARSFQITSIFPDLTVHENIRIAAQSVSRESYNFLKHFKKLKETRRKADELLEIVDLADKGSVIAKNLSYGQKRILDIGISLATDPEVLLLDEPMAGLQEADLQWMMELIKKLSDTYTVLLIDHNVDLITSISHVITVLNQGHVIAEGNPEEVRNNDRVQEAYLGGY